VNLALVMCSYVSDDNGDVGLRTLEVIHRLAYRSVLVVNLLQQKNDLHEAGPGPAGPPAVLVVVERRPDPAHQIAEHNELVVLQRDKPQIVLRTPQKRQQEHEVVLVRQICVLLAPDPVEGHVDIKKDRAEIN